MARDEQQEDLRRALELHLWCLGILDIQIPGDGSSDHINSDRLRTPFAIGLLIVALVMPMLYALTKVASNLLLVIDNLATTSAVLIVVIKLLILWRNRRSEASFDEYHNCSFLQILILEMMNDWRAEKTPWEQLKMKEQARLVRFVTIGGHMTAFLSVGILLFAPLFGLEARVLNNITDPGMDSGRVFPTQTSYPFNATKSPVFEVIYFSMVVGGLVVGFGQVASDQLFCAVNFHAMSQYQILGNRMQHIFDELIIDSRESNAKVIQISLKKIVDSEISLSRFTQNAEKVFNLIILAEVVALSVTVCCFCCGAIYAVTSENETITFIRIFAAADPVLGFMALVFAICYASEMLAHQRLKCAEQIYFSDWYSIPSCKSQKLIIFIMLKFQTPTPLTAGGFFNLSLEFFVSISKTIFSYISILTTLTR